MNSINNLNTKHIIMNSIIRKSFFIILSSLMLTANAQQTPLFGFNSQLLNVSNPSMTRTASPLNVTLAGRKYWTGIQGSPEAFIGSFSISPTTQKSAFGGFLWAENAPMISKQVYGLNYAYALKNMDENNNLRFGAGLDFISVSSNTASIIANDYNDPYYTALFNNNKSSVDFRTGATWNNDVLEIGVAVQQLIQSKNLIGETVKEELEFNNARLINGHIKYTIQTDEDMFITPLVFWQVQNSLPARVDINLLAEKTGKLWGGAWYRPKAAAGFMAGVWAVQDVKIGYMYEKTFLRKMSSAGNSHELVISYTPKIGSKDKINPEKYEKPAPQIVRIKDTIVIVKETRIIEKPKAAVVAPKEEKKVAAAVPGAPGKFNVVSGLFSVEANGKKFAAKLQAEGYKATLLKNPSSNQFYVSVGNFNTLEEAHKFMTAKPNPKFTFWVKEMK